MSFLERFLRSCESNEYFLGAAGKNPGQLFAKSECQVSIFFFFFFFFNGNHTMLKVFFSDPRLTYGYSFGRLRGNKDHNFRLFFA